MIEMPSVGTRAKRAHSSSTGRRSIITVAFLAVLALAVSACAAPTTTPQGSGLQATNTAGASTAPESDASSYPVKVYFSQHPDSDNDPSKVFSVQRVSPTLSVATYAIQQLIAGPTGREQGAGYYTPLANDLTGTSNCAGADFTIALNMRGAKPEQGTATLTFCRLVPLAGDLTGFRVSAEINATLLQFSNIKQVAILTQAGACFNDLKGGNDCLK